MIQFKILNAQDHLILLGTGSREDELGMRDYLTGTIWPAPATVLYVNGNYKGFFFDEETQSWKPGWAPDHPEGFGKNLDQENFKFTPRMWFKTSDYPEGNLVRMGFVARDDGFFVMIFPKKKEVLESWGEYYNAIHNYFALEEYKNPNPPVKKGALTLSPLFGSNAVNSPSDIPSAIPTQLSSNTTTFFDNAYTKPRSDDHEVLYDSNPCINHGKRIVDTFEETGIIEDDEIIFE